MKRQTQVPGVRRWFGDDFLELQSETLSAIDAFAGAYNKPCVVSGCAVSGGAVAKGYVALSAQGEGLKIMPFDGAVIATPCYLVAKKTSVNSVYADGVSRLSAYQYQAVAQAQAPAAGISFVKIETNGKCDRLPDVMQDTLHRLVTDSEKTAWNAKETPTGAQAKVDKVSSAVDTLRDFTISQLGLKETPEGAQDKATQAKRDAYSEARSLINTEHNFTAARLAEKADKTEVALKADKAELNLKANKTDTLAKLPVVQGTYHPDSYFKQCAIWYQNTGDSDDRGWYMNFGEGANFYRLQFAGDATQKLGLYLYVGNISGGIGKSYGAAEILHTGNTAQTVIAGKVSGSTYEEYIGNRCDIVPTGSKYTVTHRLGTDRYIVNITPINTLVRNFSVVRKNDSYFDIQFDNVTPFEIQILTY